MAKSTSATRLSTATRHGQRRSDDAMASPPILHVTLTQQQRFDVDHPWDVPDKGVPQRRALC